MDKLSLQFAKQAALQQIETCTDLGELKKVASSLASAHFASRELMCTLLEDNLKLMAQRCSDCPLR